MKTPLNQQVNQASIDLIKSYQKAIKVLMKNGNKDPSRHFQDFLNIGTIYQKWLAELILEPKKLIKANTQWLQDYMDLLAHCQEKRLEKDLPPKVNALPKDRRFKGKEWQEKPVYYFLQQSYLLFSRHCIQFIQQNPSRDLKTTKQIKFFTAQFLDAISPSNYILTNPEVLEQTLITQGENILKGIQNYLEDFAHGQGYFNIKMTDLSAFKVGENIAVTPGKVIFQNRLMQLIQYTPTTTQVYQHPLLMIPPWINKYYILDLSESNSLVKWVVDQGFSVFMISWVNPDKNHSDLTFSDYMMDGVLAALDFIERVTGEKSVNVLGFCMGGTLLAATLSYMQAKNDKRIKSATFLATLIDFSDPGDIGVFIDENQISALEKRMDMAGYLDGRLLMNTFNLLRSNDLMWSYYINNYLFGQNPFPFDMLFWNSDPIHLPANMHRYCLRNMYLENRLIKGELTLAGVRLDIRRINIPTYFLSTEQDHIAPWQTTFNGAKALCGPVTFVLSGSGHIAGVVNPPNSNKYNYRVAKNGFKIEGDPETWLANTSVFSGSWWEHWSTWLKAYAGKKIKATMKISDKMKPLQDAPGDYVKRRII